MKKRNKVVKTHNLANAVENLSIKELKFILIIISQITQEDDEFEEQEYSIKDLDERLLCKHNYTRIDKFTDSLASKFVKIPIESDNWGKDIDDDKNKKFFTKKMPWFEYISFSNDTKLITLKLNSALKPYLLNINSHFIRYNLGYILHLRNKYTIRLYELLMKIKDEKIYTLDELNNILYTSKTIKSNYGQFKRSILDIAIKEMKQYSNFYFSYIPYKQIGKKVISIKLKKIENKSEIVKKYFLDGRTKEDKILDSRFSYLIGKTIRIKFNIPIESTELHIIKNIAVQPVVNSNPLYILELKNGMFFNFPTLQEVEDSIVNF